MKSSLSTTILALITIISATPSTPPPGTTPDICFRLHGSNNKWLECDSSGPLNFKSAPQKSGLFILDSQSQLRNADTGALASQDPIGHKNYGYVEMNRDGKVDRGDDRLDCWREGEVLKCAVQGGDETYEKGGLFYVGSGFERTSKHAKKVVLGVVEEQCHVPNFWTTWSL